MGGEWNFEFRGNPSTFDTLRYQAELKKMRKAFKPKFENLQKNGPTPHPYGPFKFEVCWNPEDVMKETNVFALFSYKCQRHSFWKNEEDETAGTQVNLDLGKGSRKRKRATKPYQHQWVLFWDPTLPSKIRGTTLCARCSGYDFKLMSNEIQMQVVGLFPKHFQLYWGDGVDGYGEDEESYGISNSEVEDWKKQVNESREPKMDS